LISRETRERLRHTHTHTHTHTLLLLDVWITVIRSTLNTAARVVFTTQIWSSRWTPGSSLCFCCWSLKVRSVCV